MARILVSGAAGQLGREATEVLSRAGFEVAATAREQLDVEDRDACLELIGELRPAVVLDCSAPLPVGAEADDAEHSDARGRGAENLALAAAQASAYSIYISSAEVFDGAQVQPYVESDGPSPAAPFGAAKLAAERAVARVNPRHAIVRSSWLFGAHPASFAESLIEDARLLDQLPVDAAVRSSPTYTVHLAGALLALVRRPAYGVFHLTASGSATKLEFARALFRALDIACEAVPADAHGVETAQLVLRTRRADAPHIATWRLGLRAYAARRAEGAASEPHDTRAE